MGVLVRTRRELPPLAHRKVRVGRGWGVGGWAGGGSGGGGGVGAHTRVSKVIPPTPPSPRVVLGVAEEGQGGNQGRKY